MEGENDLNDEEEKQKMGEVKQEMDEESDFYQKHRKSIFLLTIPLFKSHFSIVSQINQNMLSNPK